MIYKNTIKQLNEMRYQAKLTQQQLADQLNITWTTLSAYENFHKTPKADLFINWCHALGFSVTIKDDLQMCTGCGYLSDEPIKSSALACFPDSNYLSTKEPAFTGSL